MTTDTDTNADADATADQTLDVRTIDGPPFDDIMAALESLEVGNRLELIAPFEPKPLYEALGERGYTYESEQADDGETWHVFIEHE